MAANEIHLEDIGTRFQVTLYDDDVAVDVTGASITFYFQKPDQTTLTKSGVIGDAAGGVVYYDTVAGDLDQVGSWKLQVRVVYDASHDWKSDIGKFKVYTNLVLDR